MRSSSEGKEKALSTNPKVLLCTPYRTHDTDYWEYIRENVYFLPRVTIERRMNLGLRYIKQNVPEVEILEFPLWHEYVQKLKEGWDVVGFSFFQREIEHVKRMIAEARRQGIKEIWAGGHGALDEHVPALVDRVFTGAGEDPVARVFGKRVTNEAVEHPVGMMHINFVPGRIRHLTLGVMYTQRGCPYKCTFCQTPVYENNMYTVNFESVERVVAYYKKLGINDIMLLDELFGIDQKFADKLTLLFAKHKIRWWAQSRAALFMRNLDTWYERGLRFPVIGVETMSQSAMDGIDKRQRIEQVYEFSRRTREKPGMYRMAFYMIGYDNLNAEETIADALRLKRAGFDAHQVNVITPFPKTLLWDELSTRYGIFDSAYPHYDAKHLVWNHPHILPGEMKYLLKTVIGTLNKPLDIYGRGFTRLVLNRLRSDGPYFIWRDLVKGPLDSTRIDDRKQVYFTNLCQKEV